MSNAAFNAWIDYRDSHPDEEHPDYEILDEVADWCGRRVEDLEAECERLRRELRDSQNYRIEAAHDRGIEIERLRDENRILRESTYCAYCGAKFPLDEAASEQVSGHIRTCPKHPMRQVEEDLAELRPLAKRLADENAKLREQLAEAHETIRQAVDGYSADLRRSDLRAEEASAEIGRLRSSIEREQDLLRDVVRQRDELMRERDEVTADWRGVTEQWRHALAQLDEAREEIATLRVTLGTLPAVEALSPLSLSVQRRHAAQGRPDPLICPACGCAWPELTPGTEDTVTCACGRVLGCARRHR